MSTRQHESVRLPLPNGGGLQLHLSHEGKPADWAVVSVHGLGSARMGEKAQALESACARRGWTFAAFDFRGHGESTGTMLELRGSALLEDLEAIRIFLASRGVHRLGLVGSSMGGWAAAWFTIRHPEVVPACVLMAPAFDFIHRSWTRLTEAERLTWRQTGRLRVQNEWIDTELGYGLVEEIDRYPVERLATEWSRPLLIFHGVQDEVIPHTNSIAFLESCGHPEIELRLYKNGEHRLIRFKEEMAEATCAFLARWLPVSA